MRYAILLYDDVPAAAAAGALAASGRLVAGERLLPARAATCVRRGTDGLAVGDGPCRAGSDLRALYVIDAPDLDDAIAWADRLAGGAGAAVEIRPCRPSVGPLSIPDAPARPGLDTP